MLTNTIQFRVRFNETDPLGIVWHGHYITYFEDGREAFGRQHEISYHLLKENGLWTPIVKCVCEYKKPLKYGDMATIQTTYVENPAAKIILRYQIWNEKQETVATGETIQVFTDFDGELQIITPTFYEEWKDKKGIK